MTKKCKVGILNPPDYSVGWLHGFQVEECEGSLLSSLHPKCPSGRACVPALRSELGGGRWTVVRVLLPAQAAAVVELSGMFLSVSRLSTSVGRSLSDPGTPRTWVPPGCASRQTLERFR